MSPGKPEAAGDPVAEAEGDASEDEPLAEVGLTGGLPGRSDAAEQKLGDFTTTPDVLKLVPLALVIGALSAGIALALLDMIGFFTNLFYYQRISVQLVSPSANTLGAVAILIPVFGGLVVGLMGLYALK